MGRPVGEPDRQLAAAQRSHALPDRAELRLCGSVRCDLPRRLGQSQLAPQSSPHLGELRHLQVSAQWRFIGRTHFDNNSPQVLLANQEEGFFDPFRQRIPNYSYLDMTAVWTVGPRLQVRVGCNNVFDKDPPFLPLEISGRGGNLNTFPAYDILGRNIFIALRATY